MNTEMHRGLNMKCRYICLITIKCNSAKNIVEFPNIKFYKNPFRSSSVVIIIR